MQVVGASVWDVPDQRGKEMQVVGASAWDVPRPEMKKGTGSRGKYVGCPDWES